MADAPDGMTLRLLHAHGKMEWTLTKLTDVKDEWVFIDEDGKGRLKVTTEELEELGDQHEQPFMPD